MSLYSENIKYLRIKRNVSQQVAADAIGIPRPRYAKYEDGVNFPPPETLVGISHYFNTSIDLLLSVDIRKVPFEDLLKLENNRILLPITVDKNGNNFIEIVPHKAKAGYTTGYSDPGFIENLPQISLPWLGPGKHRAFPVDGDSMPPHNNKSFIVGRYVENLGEVTDGKTYIVLTKSEGIVYKRLNKNGKNALMLHSDNRFYKPYEVKISEVLEIWEYACSIETEKFKPDDSVPKSVEEMFVELRKEMREVHRKIA